MKGMVINLKNIFLCGFMGCGKSTVGTELAALLSMNFIDMDKYIEKSVGKLIPEIFESEGEAKFREYEHSAVKELSGKSGIVVATGGGAVMSHKNVVTMKAGGVLVFIDVPLDIIALRLENDHTRPLLRNPDKLETMRSLYERRMPVYRETADIIIENRDNCPAASVAQRIAALPEIKRLLHC